jgi:magnesium transporter
METLEIRQDIIRTFSQRFPAEAAEILNSASESEIIDYLQNLPLHVAKEVFLKLNSDVSASVLTKIDDSFFLELFQTIDQYRGAILITRLSEEVAKEKLALLPDKLQKDLQELMSYPSESAGFLMDTKIITFHPDNAGLPGRREVLHSYPKDDFTQTKLVVSG